MKGSAVNEPRVALKSDLYFAFVTAYQDVMGWIRELMRQHGITLAQYGVLRNLEDLDGVRLSDLSERLVCANSNVTRLIDCLSEQGLVERIEDRADRRVTRARLTKQGRRLRDKITPQYEAYLETLTSGFTDKERAAFTQLLAKMRGRALKPAAS
jgi:MarR family transcriptional regulator, 2-MHQ and catechol-resistance regulon repressor